MIRVIPQGTVVNQWPDCAVHGYELRMFLAKAFSPTDTINIAHMTRFKQRISLPHPLALSGCAMCYATVVGI